MEQIILFTPLLGALLAIYGWRVIGEVAAMWIATTLMLLVALFGWILFLSHDGMVVQTEIMRWVQSGTLDTVWGLRTDRLSVLMLMIVTSVSAMAHIYAIAALEGDGEWGKGEAYRARFFAYLGFMTFALGLTVLADDLLQLAAGWGLIGVASYLLIGFHHKRPAANAAAMRGFVMGRIGDAALVLALALIFGRVESLRLEDLLSGVQSGAMQGVVPGTGLPLSELVGLLLVLAAMTASAQILFTGRLTDICEAPSPVPAVIQGGSVLAAGVFLIARFDGLFATAPVAQGAMITVGLATAIYGAVAAAVQDDLRRALAYGAASQMGLIFAAMGYGATGAGLLHLLVLGFVMTLVSLGAGAVLRAMGGDRDLRHHGGLRRAMPMSFWLMGIGLAALIGLGLPFGGVGLGTAASLDAMARFIWAGSAGGAGFWLVILSVGVTGFYAGRLFFLIFFGKPHGDKHVHETATDAPWLMRGPMMALALGAVLSGMIWQGAFVAPGARFDGFWGDMAPLGAAVEVSDMPVWAGLMAWAAAMVGLGLAVLAYLIVPGLSGRVFKGIDPMGRALREGLFIDALLDAIIRRPATVLGRVAVRWGDGKILDGAVNGLSLGLVPWAARRVGQWQSGQTLSYGLAMVIGAVALIIWLSVAGGQSPTQTATDTAPVAQTKEESKP